MKNNKIEIITFRCTKELKDYLKTKGNMSKYITELIEINKEIEDYLSTI